MGRGRCEKSLKKGKAMKQRLIITGMLVGLVVPLWIVGDWRGLGPLLREFPPLTQYVEHAPFSPFVFFVFMLLGVGAALVLLRPGWFGFKRSSPPDSPVFSRMPLWGWIGLILIIVFWILAWGRFDWLPGVIRENTFFPLWLGYILTMDGLRYRRTGNSLLSRSPRLFVALFPASALAWWYFEFVNRFVQNWWYAGVEDYSALRYVGMATLSFSTVFPAIFTTRDWLSSFPWFKAVYSNGPRWRAWSRPEVAGWFFAGIGLLGLTAWMPVPLFFMIWLAPLMVVATGLALAGVPSPFTDLKRGDYHMLFTLALAALICGFFWEMWNIFSMPKWHYSIPYAQALHVFEMPLPGYAGYLPFGPICWCMWLGMKRLLSTG